MTVTQSNRKRAGDGRFEADLMKGLDLFYSKFFGARGRNEHGKS